MNSPQLKLPIQYSVAYPHYKQSLPLIETTNFDEGYIRIDGRVSWLFRKFNFILVYVYATVKDKFVNKTSIFIKALPG